jgi:hypothetical protein
MWALFANRVGNKAHMSVTVPNSESQLCAKISRIHDILLITHLSTFLMAVQICTATYTVAVSLEKLLGGPYYPQLPYSVPVMGSI